MYLLPFKIKICGVTTPGDAQLAVRAGADAIGLNFYSKSKRCVTSQQAAAIAAVIPTGVTKIGVFVNPSLDEIRAAIKDVPLDMIQLHGDEPPEFLQQLRAQHAMPILRALRWGAEGDRPIDEYLKNCSALKCLPAAVLIDSSKPGQYGGTGETADWTTIGQWQKNLALDIPLVLAGGLIPNNVAAAIRSVQPDGVDTASGVESSPGHKDPALVSCFIEQAKKAFART